jgi:TDG/mug DNA glycosylase family protein
METICCFDPIAAPNATMLILGSMPGKQSLEANEYYAHTRNAFWRIMEVVLDFPTGLDYPSRCLALIAARIALWDVLKTCIRDGSLDADIEPATIVPNDFAGFLHDHPAIDLICFNGATAEQIWKKHVAPALPHRYAGIRTWRLPSTSPAHAAQTLEMKTGLWRAVLADA